MIVFFKEYLLDKLKVRPSNWTDAEISDAIAELVVRRGDLKERILGKKVNPETRTSLWIGSVFVMDRVAGLRETYVVLSISPQRAWRLNDDKVVNPKLTTAPRAYPEDLQLRHALWRFARDHRRVERQLQARRNGYLELLRQFKEVLH